MTKITKFRGANYFLSNFYNAPVNYDGLTYQNNEAAFQAAKLATNNHVDTKTHMTRHDFTQLPPNEAKRAGRRVQLRPDWESVKVQVMTDIVTNKFTHHQKLAQKLIATGDADLYEGNHWHDYEWGVDERSLKGKNHLGKILMQVRAKLIANNSKGIIK